MRCLYCGNELALLKKLTGGGEFCSEAHRQKYQEEYNRLALSRLLQAQPEPLERPSFEKPVGAPAHARQSVESSQAVAMPVAVAEEVAPISVSRPSQARSAQPAAPPEQGFLLDGFEPMLSPSELLASEPYLTPIPAVLPRALPERISGPRLQEPDSVALPDLQGGWDQTASTAAPRVDPRDFARTAPLVRIPAEKIQALGLAAECEPLEIVIHPAVSTTAKPWSAGERDFEFRLAFALNADEMIQPLPVAEQDLAAGVLAEAPAETAAPVPEPTESGQSSYSEEPASREESVAVEALPPAEPEATIEPAPEPAVEIEAAPAPRIPKAATEMLAVDLTAAPAPPAKPAAASGFFTTGVFPVTIPNLEPAALRSKMIYGERPAPAAAEAAAAPAPAPVPAEPEMETAKPPAATGKRDQKRNGKANGKSAPTPAPVPVPAAAKPVEAKPVEAKPVEVKPVEAAPMADPVAAQAAPRVSKTRPQLRPDETPKKVASLDLDDLRLTLEHSDINSPIGGAWSRMNLPKRIAVSAGLVLALVIAGFLLKSSFAKAPQPPAGEAAIEAVGPSLIAGEGGWTVDWNGAGSEGRQISLFRPSLTMADYRIEFQGQIESKSIGWVFRAANPRNYYVTRIEMKTPGLNPTVVIAHYAVINGEETQHAETPLPFPVHIDTEYKVRTDVYGSHFNTYLQEKLVDSWSDDRLKSGGFGLESARTDRPQIRRVQLFELRTGK